MDSMDLDTPTQLTYERSLYVGAMITMVLYGMNLIAYFTSIHYLVSKPANRHNARFYIAFSTGLLVLWTIAHACNAIFGQYMWIDHRDTEGGPAAYFIQSISAWYNTLGTTAGLALNFMGDSLLIYRCYVIWGSSWLVIAFPILIYLGAISMAIILIYESAQPSASFFQGDAVSYGVPYSSLTVSLNIIVTLLICYRLISVRNQVRRVLGNEHAKMYTSIAAIMIESAAPFTILGIAYIISYAKHSPTSFAFVQVWGDFGAISPQLIILRVAMGRGWTRQTGQISGQASDIIFDSQEKGHASRPLETVGSSDLEGFSTTMASSSAYKSQNGSSLV